MLIVSYIIVAALEIVMTVRSYQLGLQTVGWAYGFLLLLSLLSIIVENSNAGIKVRDELKEIGIDTEEFDTGANFSRVLIYGFILIGLVDLTYGVVLAYISILIWFFIIANKMKEK